MSEEVSEEVSEEDRLDKIEKKLDKLEKFTVTLVQVFDAALKKLEKITEDVEVDIKELEKKKKGAKKK